MQSENQPQGAGSGEPAEAGEFAVPTEILEDLLEAREKAAFVERKLNAVMPLLCRLRRPAPAEGLPVAEQAIKDHGPYQQVFPAPATGRECWVEFGPTGKPSNQIPLMRPPGPDDVCDGYTWVRMVEPPPPSPAREDEEPSGTASLRGAARLEEPVPGVASLEFSTQEGRVKVLFPVAMDESRLSLALLEAADFLVAPSVEITSDEQLEALKATAPSPDLGRAWNLLADAMHVLDAVVVLGPLDQNRKASVHTKIEEAHGIVQRFLAQGSEARSALPSSAGPSPSSPPAPPSQDAKDLVQAYRLAVVASFQKPWSELMAWEESAKQALLTALASQPPPSQGARMVFRDGNHLPKLAPSERAPEAPDLEALRDGFSKIVFNAQLGWPARQNACVDLVRTTLWEKSDPSAAGPLRDAKRVEEPGAYRDALETIVERVRMYKSPRPGDASVYVSQIELAQIAAASLATKAESSPPLPNGEGSSPEASEGKEVDRG